MSEHTFEILEIGSKEISPRMSISGILLELHRKTSKYLKIEELKDGYSYKIYAWHAYVGIWKENSKGFVIARYKCGEKPYLFTEYHWDVEDDGTVKPIKLIEKYPFKRKENTRQYNLQKD